MLEMAFACLGGSPQQARHALLLAQSLREFGGSLSGSPVMVLVPVGGAMDPQVEADLRRSAAGIVPFVLPPALEEVPLAERAAGAAQAEAAAQETARLLVWLDSDSLILREPVSLRIPNEARFGCRPVDLRLIGSPWEEEPDGFWKAVYAGCGVDPGRLFPVRTTVEREEIRAYYNAGCLVARPEARMLRRWESGILTLAGREPFGALDGRERLFFHQAVLAGTLMAALTKEETAELPPTVNYPLHLHDRIPPERRVARLTDAETCRYESVFDHDDWATRIPVDAPLRAWLEARRELARNN